MPFLLEQWEIRGKMVQRLIDDRPSPDIRRHTRATSIICCDQVNRGDKNKHGGYKEKLSRGNGSVDFQIEIWDVDLWKRHGEKPDKRVSCTAKGVYKSGSWDRVRNLARIPRLSFA